MKLISHFYLSLTEMLGSCSSSPVAAAAAPSRSLSMTKCYINEKMKI